MAKGKPKKTPKKKLLRLSDEHYQILAEECIRILLNAHRSDRAQIEIRVPEGYRLPDGFPDPLTKKSKGKHRPHLVLDWLYSQGFSAMNWEQLKKHKIEMRVMLLNMENKLIVMRRKAIDKCQQKIHNVENKLEEQGEKLNEDE